MKNLLSLLMAGWAAAQVEVDGVQMLCGDSNNMDQEYGEFDYMPLCLVIENYDVDEPN